MPTSDRMDVTHARRHVATTRQRSASFTELETALRIDEHTLEADCVHQPTLFYEVAKRIAELEAERDKLKQSLADKSAEIELLVREEAYASDSKVTVNEVAARVSRDGAVTRLTSTLLDLTGEIGKWKALKESYLQRRDSLRELVALYINNYYADPARGAEGRFKDTATEKLRLARRERDRNERDRNNSR